MPQDANQQLTDYLHRRLNYLEQSVAEIEDKLSLDHASVLEKIDAGEYSISERASVPIERELVGP